MKSDDAEVNKVLWNRPAMEDFPFKEFGPKKQFKVTGSEQFIPMGFDPKKWNRVCTQNKRYNL